MKLERALPRWFEEHPGIYRRADFVSKMAAYVSVAGWLALAALQQEFGAWGLGVAVDNWITLLWPIALAAVVVRWVVWMSGPRGSGAGQKR